MQAPRLVADQLVLDAPSVADAEEWSAAQDDECARWFDWPCPPGVERCRAHLARVSEDTSPDAVTWAIRTPGGLAGGIDLKRLVDEPGDDRGGSWNVSYFVHPAHQGRGVATRALRRVCDWAFTDLGLDAVTTRVHVDNLASQRVLERAGFHRTGSAPNPDADHLDLCYRLQRPASPA